ncbi:MAG: hypothetical protein EAX95_02725 [Candidatus Thorarchaeota archaeon]|nr:hypothetical protein [Candidatus Thorarchaeota archaeon]
MHMKQRMTPTMIFLLKDEPLYLCCRSRLLQNGFILKKYMRMNENDLFVEGSKSLHGKKHFRRITAVIAGQVLDSRGSGFQTNLLWGFYV